MLCAKASFASLSMRAQKQLPEKASAYLYSYWSAHHYDGNSACGKRACILQGWVQTMCLCTLLLFSGSRSPIWEKVKGCIQGHELVVAKMFASLVFPVLGMRSRCCSISTLPQIAVHWFFSHWTWREPLRTKSCLSAQLSPRFYFLVTLECDRTLQQCDGKLDTGLY